METEQLTAQVIAARLTAAIKDGDLTEITRYRTLQQCLPLQQLGQFLREAEGRVDRWTAPMEKARADEYSQTMEQRRQEKEFGSGPSGVSMDSSGNITARRFTGDTRKEISISPTSTNAHRSCRRGRKQPAVR